MESIVIQAVSEHFGVNIRASRARMFELFDNERGGAFAHHKTITQQVKRTASKSRIALPPAHRFNNVERTDGNGRQRRFCSAGDNHIRKVVPDVTQCLADRYSATGATIRICRADSAKSEFDCNIGMSRTTEYLNGERRL